MRKISSLASKDVAVDRLLTKTGYENVAVVAQYVEPIAQLSTIVDEGVDFNTLAQVLSNLDSIDSAKLSELATANLLEITEDLAKGSYLGSRKIDINLSLKMAQDGTPAYYQGAYVITEDGINIAIPFYAEGTTIVSETSSPSIILQNIRKGIKKYNTEESNVFLHVTNTEYDLLNEVDVTKPTIIRIRDTDGHSSTISRIELIRFPNENVESYVWADTTSALEVLANRVQELITIGQSINSIIVLASKIDELLILQNNIGQLVGDPDSLYINIDKLVEIYTEINKLKTVYEDIKENGTNYTNTVAIDLQDANSKIKRLANDLALESTGVVGTIVDNLPKITTVYDNITNGKLITIFNEINNGNTAKIVNNIDNENFTKLVTKIDDNSIEKVVANIDNNNINKVVGSVDDNSLTTVADNVVALEEIQTNLTEILASTNNADIAKAKALEATNQANIATNKADSIHTLQAQSLTLTAGSNASVSYDSSNNKLIIGVPQGPKGERGAAFNVDATGLFSDRSSYDGQSKGYSFLATDTGELYIKQSDSSGDWNEGIPFGKGDKGDTGNGIVNISFTSTTDPSGLHSKLNAIDTYTILFDDGSTTTFDVANGFGKTIVLCTSDYTAKKSDECLCDTTSIQQIDSIHSIVAEDDADYSIKINNSTLTYHSDTYVNQTDTVDNIVVENDTTYKLSIDIEDNTYTATYQSDAAVSQIDIVDDITVEDDTEYKIKINNTEISYQSDAAVAQVETITEINVQNNVDYTVTIEDTDITYHSDEAVAQVETITNITVANTQTYALTVNGTEVSYTSDEDATLQEVIDGLIDAVNNDNDVSTIVTAESISEGFKLTADTAGTSFTTEITSGSMDLDTTTENDKATETEILNGLKDAINGTSDLPVVASSISNGVKVKANTAGVGYSMNAKTSNMTVTMVEDNDNATLNEILNGLKSAVDNSSEPIDTSKSGDTLRLIAHNAGTPFTTEAISSNLQVHTDTENDNATLEEIVEGITNAINDNVTGVTATAKSTYLIIVADDHDTTFTTAIIEGGMTISSLSADEATLNEIINGLNNIINNSSEPIEATIETDNTIIVKASTVGQGYSIAVIAGNMSLTSVTANQEGIKVLTLPANPEFGDTVIIEDIASSFENRNLTVARNGNLIKGKDDDLEIDVNDIKVEMVFINNDWRYE